MKRVNLIVFRVRQQLTQEEMSKRIGFSRSQYACVENGKRNGIDSFWYNLQNEFKIPDAEMWSLKKKGE